MLATGLEPVPPGVARRRWLLALGVGLSAAVLLMLQTLGPLENLGAATRIPMFQAKLGAPLALAAAALAVVQRLAIPGTDARRLLPRLAVPLLFLWALAGGVLLAVPPAARIALVMGETWDVCPLLICGLALPTFGTAICALRGLAPTRLRLAGFAAGLLAGGVGAGVYAFHCSELAAPFVATWYVLGLLIPAATGALAGPALLRWWPRAPRTCILATRVPRRPLAKRPRSASEDPAMPQSFRPLHPLFAAEVSRCELRDIHAPAELEALRHGMRTHAVLVFRNQHLDDASQLAFAARFDGALHAKTGSSALGANRFGNEALADISNLDEHGALLARDDRRRAYGLANRLWHTDASFVDPPGRYSLLSARTLPPAGADTEFADMRAAWDALPQARQAALLPLTAHHSIAYSREVLGFTFSGEEAERLAGVVQPLVRTNPVSGRRSLYLAAHASCIVDWPLPEGRLLLRELIEHATQPQFVYCHRWQDGDLVIWDNLATMHRARPFDDLTQPRDLRRVTTLDLPRMEGAGG